MKNKISLEKARKQKKLDKFIKQHPSEGDVNEFENIFQGMAKTHSKAKKAFDLP